MLESLRHFLAIAEHGTFTVAAEHVHLSQPALTASIQRLEDTFGAKLLTRSRRGAVPTAAGHALLPRARAALAAIEDGKRAIAEIAGLHAGEVRIGAGATACTYLLPPFIQRFRKQHPAIRFVLRELVPEAVGHAIDDGELDLGIVTDPRGEPWRQDELVFVAKKGTSAKIDLRSAAFVTFPRGSTTRAFLDEILPGADVVMELSGMAAVKANVRAGVGVALISRAAVEADLEAGRLVLLKQAKSVTRTIHLVHRGVGSLSPAVAAFRALLLEPEARDEAD